MGFVDRLTALCENKKYKPTEHKRILKLMRHSADHFRGKGRLEEDGLQRCLAELQEDDEMAETVPPSDLDLEEESVSTSGRSQVLEAVEAGLLQMQGIVPNSKQDGILRLLLESPNGSNNRIKGNTKLERATALRMSSMLTAMSFPSIG